MRSRNPAGTPGPVSATDSRTTPGRRRQVHVQLARGGVRKRLLRVREQVQDALLQIARASAHGEALHGRVPQHGDARAPELIRSQRQRAVHDRAEIEPLLRSGRLPHVAHDLLDLAAGAIRLRADTPDADQHVRRQIVAFGKQLDNAADDLQRVVQLVCEGGDEAGDSGEPVDLRKALRGERRDGWCPGILP